MKWLERLAVPATRPVVFLIFLSIAAALFFPFAYNRFHYDDFFWISILEEKIPYNPWIGFWSVDASQFKGFTASWWVETKDPGEFYRPIFSAIVAGFYKAFGRSAALPLHILAIVLHATNAFLTYALLRRISRRYFLSLFAGILYLISEDHSMTVGWISTATDIVAVFFINLSLLAWHKGREEGAVYSLLSLLLMMCAFAGKETAIAAPAFILLYEFVFAGTHNPGHSFPPRITGFLRSWKSWSFAYFLFFGYLLFYKFAGFGTNNLAYYDPLKEPMRYLHSLAVNLPIMYAGFLSNIPIGLTLFVPEAVAPVVIAGVLLFILVSAALIPYRKDRVIQFCYLFFIVALIPQLATEATERQLYFPMVTGSYVISFLIFQIPTLRHSFCPDTPDPVRGLGRGMGLYLFFSSFVLALVLSLTYAFSFKASLESPETAVLKAKAIVDKVKPDAVIHLNGPGPFFSFYAPDIYRYHAGRYINARVLSSFNGKVWVRQNDARSFSLKTDKAGWLSGMFAKIVRLNPKFEKGRRFKNDTFTVIIEETTSDAGDVLQARFDFGRLLTDPRLFFVQYENGAMKRWDFSAGADAAWRLVGDTSNVMEGMQ